MMCIRGAQAKYTFRALTANSQLRNHLQGFARWNIFNSLSLSLISLKPNPAEADSDC
jgi:hypothetical protein